MNEGNKEHLSKAVRHYHVLFRFPSYRVLMILMLFFNLGVSITLFATTQSYGITEGLMFGLKVLTIPTIIADLLVWFFINRDDVTYNLRRSTALSLSTCILVLLIIIINSIVTSFQLSLSYVTLFAICTTFSLRYLVIHSIFLLERWKKLISTVFQPIFCVLSAIAFWGSWSVDILVVSFVSSISLLIATHVFIYIVDEYGKRAVGISAFSLLKGFFANWLESLKLPLEDYFEKIGSYSDVSIALLAFKNKESIQSMMVVPGFHPGPFKNLGSSNLPYRIQKALEERFGVIVAVPHGTAGHEMDLTSNFQCEKVINGIFGFTNFSFFSSEASRVVRKELGSANATCQFFGDCALVTITSSKGMEDVPKSVGLDIMKSGLKMGVGKVIVVDAHNNIGSEQENFWLSQQDLQALRTTAEEAITFGLKELQKPFNIGVARIIPSEFSVCDGMGLGGIVVFVITVGGQKFAYITIDGNNMVSGLREKILESLMGHGIDDAEVLTTDTHFVNAKALTKRGYYPLGESIDQDKLVSYIEEAVLQALSNMQKSEFSYSGGDLYNIKTIGDEKLVSLSLFVDSTIGFAKLLFFLIFIPTTLIALLPFHRLL